MLVNMITLVEAIKEPMNLFFLILMGVLFCHSLYKTIKNPKEESVVPNLIASLGIIGTFLGILIGLMDFDAENIERSIPSLLEGMKTAFITSILGLVLSNILKALKSEREKAYDKKNNKFEDVSLEKIASLMSDMKEAIVDSNSNLMKNIQESKEAQIETSKHNKESMDKLVNSLVGEESGTLTGQMKLLRIEMTDAQKEAQESLNKGLESMGKKLGNLVESNNAISKEIERGNNELIDEFRVFAKNMAENNMKAFTEAIQECIRDLNNQLQEQFGENFKHLNFAVEKLLEWQIHYKETVEKTNQIQIELYTGIEKARESLIEITERTKSIVEIANKLGDKIVTFETQEMRLNDSIEVLNRISADAKNLIPNIELTVGKVSELSSNLSSELEKSNEKYVENLSNMNLKSTEAITIMTDKIGESVKLNLENIGSMSENLKVKMTEEIANIENYIEAADSRLVKHGEESIAKLAEYATEVTGKGVEEISKITSGVLGNIETTNKKLVSEISESSLKVKDETLKTIQNIYNLTESSEKSLNNVIENIEESRSKIVALAKISTESIKKSQNEIVEMINGLIKEIVQSGNLNIQSIEKQVNAIEAATARLENDGMTLTKRISDNIQTMVENNNSNLQESVTNINSQLGVALNKSLESLGNQLAAVSEKFVSDYTPLTRELKKVVELAKRVG